MTYLPEWLPCGLGGTNIRYKEVYFWLEFLVQSYNLQRIFSVEGDLSSLLPMTVVKEDTDQTVLSGFRTGSMEY